MADNKQLPWCPPWDPEEDAIETNEGINLRHDENVPDQVEQPHDSSRELWVAMEKYFNMGLSMMWGRAEADPVRNKKAKSPLVSSWSSDIERRFTLGALASMMNKADPNVKIAPIIICGRGSGNLIVIDVDLKYWPGIDVKFFLALQQTLPHIWPLLRIHKTPSGGYHLFYRTVQYIDLPSKNPKLAYKADEKEAAIESRTHGGYVLAPPGAGYTVYQDVEIPTISVEDHERIFAIARLFDEKPVTKTPPKQKAYESVYDENPFEHFNSSPAAEYVLRDNGWTFDYENSQFTHWTRPGKDGGVSASWHKDKRFFHFFTTSSEIDTSKWNGNYSPANVRCLIQYNGDWKRFYKDLVYEGFGKHKPDYERKVIERNKQSGKPLPPNFSQEAKVQLENAIIEKTEKYPHGTFWEFNVNTENYVIQRQRLEYFMHSLGLRLYKGEPCIIEGQFIRKLKEEKNKNGDRDVFNIIKSWIKEEEEEVFLKICHEFTKFWQSSGEFTVTTLSLLDESLILKSNRNVCYKYFTNGILVITKEGIDIRPFRDYKKNKIWADQVIQREFHYVDKEQQKKAMYVDFLSKALVSKPEYVQLCVGYLACGYKSKGESYFLVLQEPRDTSKGGGSGKGYFCEALSPWISVLVTNAEAVKKDIDQLIQNWNGEPLVHLSDLPKWVNLSSLKNIISDDSQRKLLYKNITNIASEDMPKFIGSTQWGLDIKSDGGVGGRVRELAFSDYFGRNYNRISDEYGGMCPEVWDSEKRKENRDWDGYFSYLADAVKAYLGVGKLDFVEDRGLWLKGFDMRFADGDSYLRNGIVDQIRVWLEMEDVTVQMVVDWYDELCRDNNIAQNRKMKMEKVHSALREYGASMGWYDYRHGEAMGVSKKYIDGVQVRIVKIKLLQEEEQTGDLWDKVQENDDEELPF